MENKEQTGMSLEESWNCENSSLADDIELCMEQNMTAKQIAAYLQHSQPINSELTQLKADNEILKAKIIKIRNELLASTNLCNSFEVDRIFSENKAHWNNYLSESL